MEVNGQLRDTDSCFASVTEQVSSSSNLSDVFGRYQAGRLAGTQQTSQARPLQTHCRGLLCNSRQNNNAKHRYLQLRERTASLIITSNLQ
jgi:hypothetical protein